MKGKFLAFLMMFSLSLGFVSCSDDDDNNSSEASYENGVKNGEEFAEAYNDYKLAEDAKEKAMAGIALYKEYEEYKESVDEDYKKGFLEGVSGASKNENVQDVKEVLGKLDGINFSDLSYIEIGEKVLELLK